MCGPHGSFLIGSPETVAAKAIAANPVLGGISRISLQLGTMLLPHDVMRRAIELLGTEVAPAIRKGASGRPAVFGS
jgi:hypothetical protein